MLCVLLTSYNLFMGCRKDFTGNMSKPINTDETSYGWDMSLTRVTELKWFFQYREDYDVRIPSYLSE